jgi:hypothetical protein
MEKSHIVRPGRYRHYKGGEYQVIDTARHSETEEWVVVYKPCYKDKNCEDLGLWVRPLNMFVEKVQIDGVCQYRFEYMGE